MTKYDLMIDDWVFNTFNKQPERVFGINELGVMLYYNDIYDLDEIEPILLTPKILDKNGFVSYSTGVAPILGITYPECSIVLAYMNDYWQITVDSIVYKIKIKYVHEFQHTLKLLNIKNEVIL